jgi:hypothetical protein
MERNMRVLSAHAKAAPLQAFVKKNRAPLLARGLAFPNQRKKRS